MLPQRYLRDWRIIWCNCPNYQNWNVYAWRCGSLDACLSFVDESTNESTSAMLAHEIYYYVIVMDSYYGEWCIISKLHNVDLDAILNGNNSDTAIICYAHALPWGIGQFLSAKRNKRLQSSMCATSLYHLGIVPTMTSSVVLLYMHQECDGFQRTLKMPNIQRFQHS